MTISERELRDAVGEVVKGADLERSSPALRAIEDAAVEEPGALRPFLLQLYGVASIRNRLLEAWRAADDVAISQLFSLAGSADDKEARDAIRALTYTRRPDVLKRLAPIPGEKYKRPSGLGFAHEVGCEQTEAGLRALHQEAVLHLTFPPEIVKSARLRDTSPSWSGFAPDRPAFRFGGRGQAPCGRCGQPIDHLVTFDPIPAAAGISGDRITLCVCLSCVYEQNGENGCRTREQGAFFRHDGAGRPTAMDVEEEPERPTYPSAPFVETKVQLVDHGPRYRIQPWGRGPGGNLFRVGGDPSWVQGAAYQKCPSCARTMTFAMQLDSGLPTTDGKRYDWANGGMAYVSWCDACRISHIQLQYT